MFRVGGGMEETRFYFLSLFTFLFILVISKLLIFNKNSVHKNLPPCPPSLPIIGHLHLIKVPVHRTLQHLSFKYGPILSLRFGSRRVIIISSPSAVEECFTTNDVILANRPHFLIGKHIHYNNTTLGSASYGPHWRNLRRIATLAMFSNTQLNTYSGIRQGEVRSLIKNLFRQSTQSFKKVEMRLRFEELNFNIVLRVIAGKRYFGEEPENVEEAKHFKDIIGDIFELGGTSNIEDFLPFFQWIDLRGIQKRMRNLRDYSDKFFQGLIEEHRAKDGISLPHNSGKSKSNTLIDTMVTLQQSEPDYYSDDIIKGIIMTLLLAGTDTSAATIEWGMSLLLNHPRVFTKARAELNKCVGEDHLINESDLPKLQFLQCIVNETLRLFPVGPLLLPHESSDDCKIGGYDVARGTIVMVNAWAIHRDPELWNDPTSFRPERFEDVGGESYKFVPFGMGRRQCPGAGLANRVVALALGSLIQCFDWQRVSEDLVDLTEGIGLTMPKKTPLEAMCRARQQMIELLSKI